jgi:hypothetical protein
LHSLSLSTAIKIDKSGIHNNWIINLSFVKIGEVEAILYWKTEINFFANIAHTLPDLGVAAPCYLLIKLLRTLELFARCRLGGSNLLMIFFNSGGLGKWCLLY